MPKLGSTSSSFIVAVVITGALTWSLASRDGLLAQGSSTVAAPSTTKAALASEAATKTTASQAKSSWAASAPGRVEPRDGEVRIVSQLPGKIAEVLVAVNDKVKAGDLMFRLEDEDHEARVAAADAEVAVRTRERDQENVGRLAKDRRTAEDAVAKAERALFAARLELDRVMAQVRAGKEAAAEVEKAREAVVAAASNIDKERANLRKVLATKDMPLPTRLESSLAVARAELAIAETGYSRTRIRAPIDGTILIVNAKVGEMASPQAELPMVVMGDLSRLRVRAEFDERDIEKVRVGQAAVVTSDAFPGRQFEAKVTQVAKSLGPPRVSQKGPRRPNDVDVLEVFVEVDGSTPLLPGMRADVFLRPDGAAAAEPASRSN